MGREQRNWHEAEEIKKRRIIMAGIVKEGPKVISARTHAVIDYLSAGTNFVAAALLWKRNRRAAVGALALGAGVLGNALMTDYPLGVFRLYSFKVHGLLDYGVAAASGLMPKMTHTRSRRPEAKYFRIQGAGETGIAALTDYDDHTGERKHHKVLS
jgi:hypothetical protein